MAMRMPADAVKCVNPAVCGVAWHRKDTRTRCGGGTVARTRVGVHVGPRQGVVDAGCPVHGLDAVEEEMAMDLSMRQVTAGLMAAAVAVSLCSCAGRSDAVDPTGGATTQPSISASVNPTAEATPGPDGRYNTDGIDLKTAEFPAEQPGYVFSDTPQSPSEQLLFDEFPELWEQGVRAVSPMYMFGYLKDDPKVPGATVQYINGKRYEGTDRMPLGFRGQTANPDVYPSDAIDARIAMLRGEEPSSNFGRGGYSVGIIENYAFARGVRDGITDANDTVLYVEMSGHAGEVFGGQPRRFADWQEAWAYLQENGISPNSTNPDARVLYPGEIASINVSREVDANGSSESYVWDPRVNDWVLVDRIEF